MKTLLQDLRYACRLAVKSPGFTLIAALTLAVGIAANTTVFSWIDTILLRPIPGVSAPSELASFETLTPSGEFITTSYLDFRDYRDNLKLLAGLAAAQPRPLSVGPDERPERVWGELVSGNYFAVLGVRPVLGRAFSREEYGDKQGGYPVAVISTSLWRRDFNSDPRVIGKILRVNRQQLTVVGVAPEEFRGTIPGLQFEVWIPAMMGAQLNVMPDWMMKDRQTRSFLCVARLKPGVTLPQARAEIAGLAERMATAYADTNTGISATVLPIWKSHFGAQTLLLKPLQILMFLGGVVLLIVCANVANLLLARGAARRKEFSLRMSLGARRGRLVRQLLSESVLLASLGAAFGVPLAMWMRSALGYLVPPGILPIVLDNELNGDILAFTVIICVLACVISGIAPALSATRVELNEALNEGGRSGTAGSQSQRMRRLLVASEVALALVATIGAALFARSFHLARRLNPGFDAQHVIVSHLYLSTAGYSLPQRKEFCRRLADRLEAQPGIVSAVYADMIPLGFDTGPWEDLRIQGYTPGRSENMKIYRNVVSPGYFGLLRIPILDGRDFTAHDDEKSTPVMIVNQTFAKRFVAGRNPIGYKVHGWGKWFTIVGLVRDSKYHTPNEAPKPYFYVPFRQVYREDLAIAIYARTSGDAAQAVPILRREIQALDPAVGVFDAMPLTEFIETSLFPQKVAASLLSVLGAIALVLAAVGLYSVMAFMVSQRTQEIGIRLALGARATDVLGMVLRQGLMLTGVGLLAGVAAAFAVTRLASSLLIGVSATDPLIFGSGVLFLTAVAVVAALVPAYRATRVDPNTALRCQ
ncbi:MAG TPA: ABC transporter permease [Bryobacteraceae bacterium]|nr:ABC transporter permease [Bryobacteraceae bacterium]